MIVMQTLAVNLQHDLLVIGGDIYEADFGWVSGNIHGITSLAAYYIERPSLRWIITLTNYYANPVIALAISNDGKRIIAGTDNYVPGSPSSILIFIDAVLGIVLNIKEYVSNSSKPQLQIYPLNLLMVDQDYQIYHIMADVDSSRTNWLGFKVFKLDPRETDPLLMFKWQLTKNEAQKGMINIHFSGHEPLNYESSLLTLVKFAGVAYLTKLSSVDGSQLWTYTLPTYTDSNEPVFLDFSSLDESTEIITTFQIDGVSSYRIIQLELLVGQSTSAYSRNMQVQSPSQALKDIYVKTRNELFGLLQDYSSQTYFMLQINSHLSTYKINEKIPGCSASINYIKVGIIVNENNYFGASACQFTFLTNMPAYSTVKFTTNQVVSLVSSSNMTSAYYQLNLLSLETSLNILQQTQGPVSLVTATNFWATPTSTTELIQIKEASISAAGVIKGDIMKNAGIDFCSALQASPVTSQSPPSFNVPLLPTLFKARCFIETLITLPSSLDPISCPYKIYILDQNNQPIHFIRVLSLRKISVLIEECDFITKDVPFQLILGNSQFYSVYHSVLKLMNSPPPKFISPLINQEIGLNQKKTYRLPDISSYNSCAVKVSFKTLNLLQSAIIIENNSKLVFQPTQLNQIGEHVIVVVMQDIEGATSETNFTLTVHQIPSFYRILPKQINIKLNQLLQYSLPVANIEETTVTHDNEYIRFCSYVKGTYTITPMKQEDLGIWRVSGIVSNKWGEIDFSFKIKVTKDPLAKNPPRFSKELVKIIKAPQEIFQTFQLPPLPSDPEGMSVSISTQQKDQLKLPSFVTFNQTSLTYNIEPREYNSKLQVYSIEIELIDNLFKSTNYYFEIEVISQKSLPNFQVNSSSEKTIQVFFQIKLITRDQRALLKIFSGQEKCSQLIAGLISNESFQINIRTQDSQKLSYQVTDVYNQSGLIELDLKYINFRDISSNEVRLITLIKYQGE